MNKQFEILAEVDDLVIARGDNKVLCYSTDTLDGAMLVKNPLLEDNYTLAGTTLIALEEVENEQGITPTEKYFNHFSNLYENTIAQYNHITDDTWCCDITGNGSADDFNHDYYLDLHALRQDALQHMSVYDLDDEVTDEELVSDSDILEDYCIPDYLHALNMQDISVWFN